MNKNQVWKLFFVLLIIFISLGLISPFEDRELGEYALGQVTSDANTSNHVGYETFDEVIETLTAPLLIEHYETVFIKLNFR